MYSIGPRCPRPPQCPHRSTQERPHRAFHTSANLIDGVRASAARIRSGEVGPNSLEAGSVRYRVGLDGLCSAAASGRFRLVPAAGNLHLTLHSVSLHSHSQGSSAPLFQAGLPALVVRGPALQGPTLSHASPLYLEPFSPKQRSQAPLSQVKPPRLHSLGPQSPIYMLPSPNLHSQFSQDVAPSPHSLKPHSPRQRSEAQLFQTILRGRSSPTPFSHAAFSRTALGVSALLNTIPQGRISEASFSQAQFSQASLSDASFPQGPLSHATFSPISCF